MHYQFKQQQTNNFGRRVFLPTDQLTVKRRPDSKRIRHKDRVTSYTMERTTDGALVEITPHMFRHWLVKVYSAEEVLAEHSRQLDARAKAMRLAGQLAPLDTYPVIIAAPGGYTVAARAVAIRTGAVIVPWGKLVAGQPAQPATR